MNNTFDDNAWHDRLEADARSYDGGNGYYAVVRDRGPAGDRRRKPDEVFSSRIRFGDAGLWSEHADALEFARRYKAALIAHHRRVHDLKVERGLALAERLRGVNTETGEIEAERKVLGNKLKALADRRDKLITEANEPEVEIDLRPGSTEWRLFDAPSESEGTIDQSRQLVLAETGLTNPEPSEVEPDPPKGRKRKGGKAPARPGLDPNDVQWPDGPEAA